MTERHWLPAPGPIGTLPPILQQIERTADECETPTPLLGLAKAVFGRAISDGWADRDMAAAREQLEARHLMARREVASTS